MSSSGTRFPMRAHLAAVWGYVGVVAVVALVGPSFPTVFGVAADPWVLVGFAVTAALVPTLPRVAGGSDGVFRFVVTLALLLEAFTLLAVAPLLPGVRA